MAEVMRHELLEETGLAWCRVAKSELLALMNSGAEQGENGGRKGPGRGGKKGKGKGKDRRSSAGGNWRRDWNSIGAGALGNQLSTSLQKD